LLARAGQAHPDLDATYEMKSSTSLLTAVALGNKRDVRLAAAGEHAVSTSSFRSTVREIESRARAAGISGPTMSKLRDAIATALVDRPYAAAMAAEKAGKLPPITLTPPGLATAAERYGIDRDLFATAFRSPDGSAGRMDGAEPPDGLTFSLANLETGEIAPLYHQYPLQYEPQPAFIELDQNGDVSADYSREIGNAKSPEVWHRIRLRYRVSPWLRGSALAKYLRGDGRALLARIHAGHDVEWDGSDYVGVLSADAVEAEEALERALEELGTDQDNCDSEAKVAEWIEYASIVEAWPAGKTIEEAVADIVGDAASERCRISDADSAEEALLDRADTAFRRKEPLQPHHVEALFAAEMIDEDERDAWVQANVAASGDA
jgi:hypothetical protein